METAAHSAPADGLADAAAVLGWWREAGVEHVFADDPANWLAELPAPDIEQSAAITAVMKPEPAPPPAEKRVDMAAFPVQLAQFAQWWLSEPSLDSGQTSSRVAPRGAAGARLMVLVPHSEREDGERLLSGRQGALLSAMLAAMGIGEGDAYLASALPRHLPHADWAGLKAQGFGEVLARHIALAAPQRLICFGGNILSLLGHDPANNAGSSREFNHGSGTIPLLGAHELTTMLDKPRMKGPFWRNWLDWSAGDQDTSGTVGND